MTSHDPFDLRGQEKAAKKVEEQRKLQHHIEADDLRWLLGSKRGRRVVWRILEWTGIFRSSFTGNSETFFREGMRNVGLMLLAQINEVCPEHYTNMVTEQRDHGRSSNNGDDGSN